MSTTVAQLRKALAEFPDDWEVWASKSGSSVQLLPPGHITVGSRWAYVMLTNPPVVRWQTRRGRSILNYP